MKKNILKIIIFSFLVIMPYAASADLTPTTDWASYITKNQATIYGDIWCHDTGGGDCNSYYHHFRYSSHYNDLVSSDNDGDFPPRTGDEGHGQPAEGSAPFYHSRLTGLSVGTTYYYQICYHNNDWGNNGEFDCGGINSFTTLGEYPPTATTLTGAGYNGLGILNGSVNVGNLTTQTWFWYGSQHEYWPDENSAVPTGSLPHRSANANHSTDGPFSAQITQIAPVTKYYFQACASNAKDNHIPHCGAIHDFTTPSTGENTGPNTQKEIANVLTFEPPTDITDDSVVLHGKVDIKNTVGFGYFRYSKVDIPPVFCNKIYGSEMRDVQTKDTLWWNIPNQGFKATVTGLEPNTKYAYCALVSNVADGKTPTEIEYGGVGTFMTKPCTTCEPANIETNDARVINETSAYLNGSYNSTVPLETWFEYRRVGSGDWIAVPTETLSDIHLTRTTVHHVAGYDNLNFKLTGLDSGTQYEFRTVAQAKIGTTNASTRQIYYGETLNFTTDGATGVSTINPTGIGIGLPYGNDGWPSGNFPGLPCFVDANGDSSCPDNGGPLIGLDPCSLPDVPCGPTGTPLDPCLLPGNPCGPGGPGEDTLPGDDWGTPFEDDGTAGGGVFGPPDDGSNGLGTGPGTVVPAPTIGSPANPLSDAIVHYHEGVETVFTRQIIRYPGLAKLYGYKTGNNLQSFADGLSHTFAQLFGYYQAGREIRVSPPDVAAYELGLKNGMLAIYEYFGKKLTGIRTVHTVLKNRFDYEYYYRGH